MNKLKLVIGSIFLSSFAFSQDYAPAAGQAGSTAIPQDSSIFVAWATDCEVERGYINAEDTTVLFQGTNRASAGAPENAIGPIDGGVVSLGDKGVATLTFEKAITNGDGYDFAVFENAFSDNFLELAFVEVSSDGEHFVRFPTHSQTQTEEQVGGFGALEPTYIYNFAGKYRSGFGTPFDLEELKDSANLNVEQITHVRIIDVVGSIGENGTLDSYGNKVNDPFPTPFNTGGFDLSGVGVIHEYDETTAGIADNISLDFRLYPNPSEGRVNITFPADQFKVLRIYNSMGVAVDYRTIESHTSKMQLDLAPGVYFIQVQGTDGMVNKKLIIQ